MKSIVEQLDPIFKPKSLAVIGASDKPGKWGFMMLDRPLRSGFGGAIYPVNPGKSEILGLRAYPSILDIPEQVDLAVITIPADKVAQTLQDCIKKGVKGLVLITAGFAEIGAEGKALQDKVVAIAREGGIRFVGPNCMGVWSAAGNLNLCFYKKPDAGAIAFVSQSGTYGTHLSEQANARGYGLSKFISIGNQAEITASEYLDYLAHDNDTKVIVFYMEGLKDGRRFFELAREVTRKKPVVMYKGGRTPAGAKAALSHTASLAGSEEIFEAMCRQAGIIRSFEPLQSFEMAEALVRQPLPEGKRVAIMGSGGQCVVTSDACALLGLEIPEFDAETIKELEKLLPPYAPPPRNPVDFAGSYRSMKEEVEVVEKFLSLDYIDGVITNIPLDWDSWATSSKSGEPVFSTSASSVTEAEYFTALPWKYHKPIIAVRWSRTLSEVVETTLKKGGIPVYDTSEQCARAMYALARYAESRRQ